MSLSVTLFYKDLPMTATRLTQLSHKGGCGCKISPTLLKSILAKEVPTLFPKELLVGTESSDDAAVYQINEEQAVIATTDFFMPIVDDAYDFGRIAATNAISDVYAMGGRPLLALAIVGMPMNTIPLQDVQNILKGGEDTCKGAGIPIAGGHSIDSLEPIYGLCVIGLVNPKHLKRNIGAQVHDKIVIGKPIGIGIYASALKKEQLDAKSYEELLSVMTQLNTPGIALSQLQGVHALTDLTGFGLLGHLLEISSGSHVGAQIELDKIPFLPKAKELAERGFITGASRSNWESYANKISNADSLNLIARHLLTDPQTSGGLLLTCSESELDNVLKCFQDKGMQGTVIGTIIKEEKVVII